jgi:hypothetical protein
MQDIQGTSAEEPGLGSGNSPGMRKSRGRYRHDTDQAVVHILGKAFPLGGELLGAGNLQAFFAKSLFLARKEVREGRGSNRIRREQSERRRCGT